MLGADMAAAVIEYSRFCGTIGCFGATLAGPGVVERDREHSMSSTEMGMDWLLL